MATIGKIIDTKHTLPTLEPLSYICRSIMKGHNQIICNIQENISHLIKMAVNLFE